MLDIGNIVKDPDGILHYYGSNHYTIECDYKHHCFTVTVMRLDEYGDFAGQIDKISVAELSTAFQVIEEDEA
jgi:hypothetical protein